jgi:hypothetical protein
MTASLLPLPASHCCRPLSSSSSSSSSSSFNARPLSAHQLQSMLLARAGGVQEVEATTATAGIIIASDADVDALLDIASGPQGFDASTFVRSILSSSSNSNSSQASISAERSAHVLELFRRHANRQELSMLRSALLQTTSTGTATATAATAAPLFALNMKDVSGIMKACVDRGHTKEAMGWLYLAQEGYGLSCDQRTFDMLIPALAKQK